MSETIINVTKECPYCGHLNTVKVEVEKYKRWFEKKELIQTVWPDSTPEWRESLKTGIHGKCWDALFADTE